jgi:catalase
VTPPPHLTVSSVDFEQPRALWQKVWNDTDREHYVQNVAGHIRNVKKKETIARQRKSPSTSRNATCL